MSIRFFAFAFLFLATISVIAIDRSLNNSHPGRIVAVRRWLSHQNKPQIATLYANEPTICDTVKQHSGYFAIANSNKKYFYWFFEARNQSATVVPTIMWLTGGPGCSSILATLVENGPCSVNSDGVTTKSNPFSWNSNSHLLYVDQPPGTGFSEGSPDSNEVEVADDMYSFLQSFFSAYPEYNDSFFVFGESYAGHYVPAVTNRIYNGNIKSEGLFVNLTGMAIGNGLTDPEIQYAYYAQMAYNSTSAPSVISESTYNKMTRAIPSCIKAITACQSGSECKLAYLICNEAETSPVTATGINPYDLRIPCSDGNLCYNFTNVEVFLNRADVQAQLGVSKQWESCNMVVNEMFQGDWMKNYQTQIPQLLDGGIRVLIYAGDQDFICNWLGNKAWTLALDWSGKSSFNQASDLSWNVDGKEAGKIRTSGNFTFLRVYQAGHMVPMDQPQNALEMTNQFIFNRLG